MKVIVRALTFVAVVVGFNTVVVPYFLLSNRFESFSYMGGDLRFVGLLPIVTGVLVVAVGTTSFAVVGKGTPSPLDPPRLLVTQGVYSLVRNPLYLGALLILLGESLFFGSLAILVYALLLWLCFHIFILFYEEPALSRKFGDAYGEYCKEVPRWLPKIRKQRATA